VERERTASEPPLILDQLPSTEELRRLIQEQNQPRRPAAVDIGSFDGGLSAPRRAVIRAIHRYQRHVAARLGRRCLLEPTCSRYAELAVAHQGVVRGSFATYRRLRRCRPENEGLTDYPKGTHPCRTR
jgi:putative component of membrane protein insertase Oxa1/YidC/SpoIIIJ protein YidD